jgi:hypothetical protein
MKNRAWFLCLVCLACTGMAFALPQLTTPVPLPANFEGIVTIYPDNNNTQTVRRYWIVPNTGRLVRDPNGKLEFGLVHSGVSSFDPDGINALITATVQPYVDDKTLQAAKDAVQKQAQSEGAQSVTFSFVAPTQSTVRMLIGGQFVDWNGKDMTVINGGSVDAGIPFQHKITDSFDVRCLTQAGGPDAANLGAVWTMKFLGVGDQVHFKVTANVKDVYNHFLLHMKASGWFVSGDFKTEWQSLQSDGVVHLQIFSGTKADVDEYHPEEIVKSLLEQVSNRTGFFAQRLKASGLPDSPGGGGILGWGAGASGGFEHYDETETLTVEVDAAYTREQEIAFGFNFAADSNDLANYVKNVTDSSKPFPTDQDFKAQKQQNAACRTANLKALDQLLADGTISSAQHEKYVDQAIQLGCHVDYTSVAQEFRPGVKGLERKNLVPLVDMLDFATVEHARRPNAQPEPK